MRYRFFSLVLLVVSFASFSAEAGYRSQLNRATKLGRIYSIQDFDAKLIWKATFFSAEFRREFDKKHVEINYLDDAEAASFVAGEEYAQKNGWEFFVGVYTRREYKGLSTEPDSFWKIFLTTESGEKVMPESIEQKPLGPYEYIMFPYLHRWANAYRVVFPKVNLGKKFTLTLHSIAGQSILKYKMK